MKTRRNSKRRSRWTLEISLVLITLLVLGGLELQHSPITLPAKEPSVRDAPPPEGTAGSDVLIAISEGNKPSKISQWNLDQAWINTVEQEIGEYQVQAVEHFNRSELGSASWIIVPRRASGNFDASQIQMLKHWVEDGGVAIIEQPEGPWQSMIGTTLSRARLRETRRITSFDASPARGRTREKIVSMPLRTTILPFTPQGLSRGRDYQVLMEVDGTPGVVSIQHGRGKVFLVLFDFARAITSTQQGTPTTTFKTPRPEESVLPPHLAATQNLVVDKDMYESMVPWTDLLERNLLYLADLQRPVPRLWNFPDSYRGAFIVSHSGAGSGSMASFMIEWEHHAEQPSTLFTIADAISPKTLSKFRRIGASIALQWVPIGSPYVPYISWGVRNFQPVHRPMQLQQQLHVLNKNLQPYEATHVGRSLNGLWTRDYFQPFEQLEASTLTLDSSFGPAPRIIAEGRPRIGYLYGTGLPFRPLGDEGNRHSFVELPYQFTDSNEAYSIRKVRDLITDASDLYHTTIVGDWRPDTMARRPSYDALEGWRSSYELAHSQHLWVTTLAEYAQFLKYRKQAAIRSTFSERRLSIDAIIPEVERNEDGQYHDQIPSLAIPARFRGRPVEHMWRNGVPIEINELVTTGDRALLLLPMKPGEHRIEVYYGQTPTFSP